MNVCWKRILSLFLAMLLFAGMTPVGLATEETGADSEQVNITNDTPEKESPATEQTANLTDEGSKTVYRAFELSLKNAESEATDGEGYRVTVPTGINTAELMPEGAVCTGIHVTLYHIHGEEVDVIEEASVDESGILTFTTPNFSTFVLEYTVDFAFETEDGETYAFTLPGGGWISLTGLVRTLGMAQDDPATDRDEVQAFVDAIQDVSFSTPELVFIGKADGDYQVGAVKEAFGLTCEYSSELTEEEIAAINAQTIRAGDWAVISLRPFTGEETLTIALTSGKTYTVLVTDAQITQDYITASGETYTITVEYDDEALIPDGAKLEVFELSGEEYENYLGRAASAMGAGGFAYARIFDIAIVDREDNPVEPQTPVQVEVKLHDADSTGNDFSVLHFKDETDETEKMAAETNGNTVSFTTNSFSAYAIVQGPSDISLEWERISTMSRLNELVSAGVYIGTVSGYYMTDTTAVGSRDAATTGIVKTTPSSSTPAENAVFYYFEPAGADNQYYIYCFDRGGNKQYVRNTGDANLYLVTNEDQRTAFTVQVDNNGRFRINNGNRYWNMWNGANGNHIAAWTNAGDAGNYFYLWRHAELADDPYGLNGKSYGLMNWTEGTTGKAMMGSTTGDNLDALALTVMTKTGDNSDKLFVPDDSDITFWTFDWVENESYYLSTVVDGRRLYLKIENGRISLTTEAGTDCLVQVKPGTGTHAGELCLKAGGTTLTYSGNINTGFITGGTAGSEWLKLVEQSELTSDYFLIYSASKVSVSDPSVTNGSRIIVYTRVWNDTAKKYEFYAIDHDGSLVRCYESGDDIEWVGSRLNSMLWNFVEYYWEGTTDPNYYYELYNQYSEQYIAPQETGSQILSDGTIGINLNGRRDGKYYTPILAWDDANYAYVGLKANKETGKIEVCPRSEADDFYFAVVQDIPADDVLTTVSTVDHTQYGITMKMVNFGDRVAMSNFLGSSNAYVNGNTESGLLSTALGENGYPTTNAGNNLSAWFADATEVNHLFIESTYNASGYYEYDSVQNFAHLDTSTNNFVVYKEIGTTDSQSGRFYTHGQFFPYNDLEAGVFSTQKNITNALGNNLPDTDPRKYEQLYQIQNPTAPDYYLGMEVEASFTQTPDGKDAWGHDIIYEFTGDDDFWLYVDGELVIDLGGIHDALAGSVNFRTGEVYVNGRNTTLKDLFYNNYLGRGHTAAEAQAYVDGIFRQNESGQYIFKDYTTHTMNIFYLERGAGASNLHMRFNLASVKKGTVELSKDLTGVENEETILAEFPYQIKYKKKNDPTEYYLHNMVPDNPEKNDDYVFYKDTTRAASYAESLTVADVAYNDVFLLKPGETVVINFPEDAEIETYSIVECGVNTDLYSSVKANGTQLTGTGDETYAVNHRDYETGYETTDARARVAYTNEVNPDAIRMLTIRKKLYDETGAGDISDRDATDFHLRLYLGTEFGGEPAPANMHTYYIKDRNGCYCTWNVETQSFASTGVSSFSALSDTQKTAAAFTTSMNGAISKLPPGYTIEIRNVLAGTKFRVVERKNEVPDGYSFQKYEYFAQGLEGTPAADVMEYSDQEAGASATVVVNQDPHVDVRNLKGWGLRVNKVWADADYMSERDETYFAVYAKMEGTQPVLVENSVRRLSYGMTPQSVYWYYDHLPVTGTNGLEDYLIREVTISEADPTADENGVVTNPGTVTVIAEGETVKLNGKQKGESTSSQFTYTVNYQEGTISQESNVRADTVTNDRPGIVVRKTDWSGNPLAGATFTLEDSDGNQIGTFTSDENGLVTTSFLSSGKTYTLTETKAPRTPEPYHGPETSMQIVSDNSGVSVSGADQAYYTLVQSDGSNPAEITVKNRTFSLKAVKIDGERNIPLAGVEFALHKQHTVDGVTQFDPTPMAGYEHLVTDENGVIPSITEELPVGTYELREIQGAEGYVALSGHIHFTISETGIVTLETTAEAVLTASENEDSGSMDYEIKIRNSPISNIALQKLDNNNGHEIVGAKFSLYRYASSWVPVDDYEEIDMTQVSHISLTGLTPGRYRLTEIKAPDGYIIEEKDVYFKLTAKADGSFEITLTNEEGTGSSTNVLATVSGITITIRNKPGIVLPATGGPGTNRYCFLGGMLIMLAGAGYLLINRKRRAG